MPTVTTGWPECTGWKNYRYKLTRLAPVTDYIINTVTGEFANNALNIWIDDDWFTHGDALGQTYLVAMKTGIADAVRKIYKPRVFTDGTSGLSTDAQSDMGLSAKWFGVTNADTTTTVDVANSEASTIGRDNVSQSLYTVIPGLHIGFERTTSTAFANGDEFSWTMKSAALDGVEKIMDGSYTNWVAFPIAASDEVYTQTMPTYVANRSFNLNVQNIGYPKHSGSSGNTALTIILQGSNDNSAFVDIMTLVDDFDWQDGTTVGLTPYGTPIMQFQTHHDINALDGENFLYKRLKFTMEAGTGTEREVHPYQWSKVTIIPN